MPYMGMFEIAQLGCLYMCWHGIRDEIQGLLFIYLTQRSKLNLNKNCGGILCRAKCSAIKCLLNIVQAMDPVTLLVYGHFDVIRCSLSIII